MLSWRPAPPPALLQLTQRCAVSNDGDFWLAHPRRGCMGNVMNQFYEFETGRAAVLDVQTALQMLAVEQCIVPDGIWIEKYGQLLLDPDDTVAGLAGQNSVEDCEVIDCVGVVEVLCATPGVSRAAAAAALRMLCLKYGFSGEPQDVREIFATVDSARNYLMSGAEMACLQSLPHDVTVYRGQLFEGFFGEPGTQILGNSWTLSKDVAQWFSAPALGLESKERGWVLTATIPKTAILALFLDRGEHEVIVDIDSIVTFELERGVADEYPAHIAATTMAAGEVAR